MHHFKKFLPLVQLIPALTVAWIIAAALPGTAPVLEALPERLVLAAVEPASEVPAAEPEPPEPETALPYEDGIYTGSSRGYGGRIRMQVTMENGFITDLQILDASHETPSFLKRSKRLLNIVLTEQNWEVDAISEATYTSRGILGAIQNALTGEEVINPAPPKAPEAPPVLEEFTVPSRYRDGIYTGTAQGYGGEITVQVTITNDTITDITLLSAEDETRSYLTRARYVISAMLTSGTPEVDTISGATYSSAGIINAVKAALMSAATDPEPVEELPDASLPESEAAAPMQPIVEVVRPKDKRTVFLEKLRALWEQLLPHSLKEGAPESDPSLEEPAGQPEPETPKAEAPAPTPDTPPTEDESLPEDLTAPDTPEAAEASPEPDASSATEPPDQKEDAA